jgi:hypothetical protein
VLADVLMCSTDKTANFKFLDYRNVFIILHTDTSLAFRFFHCRQKLDVAQLTAL